MFPETQDPHRHEFIACGIRFILYTGSSIRPLPHPMSFANHKVAYVESGEPLLRAVSETTKASRPLGRLAEEQVGRK